MGSEIFSKVDIEDSGVDFEWPIADCRLVPLQRFESLFRSYSQSQSRIAYRLGRLNLAGRDALGLGVPKGRAVGRLLSVVESWWVENDFQPGRAACLDRLRELARKEGFGR